MKKKNLLVSFLFGLTVFLAIVLQSLHSFNHIEKDLTEKKCRHKYAKNKTEFTHKHHDLENCFVCEFTFSNSIKAEFLTYNFEKVEISSTHSFAKSREITQFFCGSLFYLRAPPSFIV